MQSIRKYRIWLYGTIYSGQSKTKVVKQAMRDWHTLPEGFAITKHDSSGNMISNTQIEGGRFFEKHER